MSRFSLSKGSRDKNKNKNRLYWGGVVLFCLNPPSSRQHKMDIQVSLTNRYQLLCSDMAEDFYFYSGDVAP